MIESDTRIATTERLDALLSLPGCATLPPDAQRELASQMGEARFAPGDVIVREGEEGDRLFVIVEGRAEVSVDKQGTPIPVATLGPGEHFGEIALLSPDARRQATVRALTALSAFSLSAENFASLVNRDPALRSHWEEQASHLLIANFLKLATPFTTLSPDDLRELAASIQPREVAAGEIIIRQGDTGDCCYLLRRGSVEVLLQEHDEPERRIATLSVGAIFGEAALLTTAHRNASVRATQPSQVLVMCRDDLLHAIREDRKAGQELMQLLHLRDRPRRVDGVQSHHRRGSDGDTITILNNPAQTAYFQLSPQGWFLWERLDGWHTMRDLTLQYFVAFKMLAPLAVAEVIGGLTAAGFVRTEALRADAASEAAGELSSWQRLLYLARRVLEWRVALTNVDPWITRAYRGGMRIFFTKTSHAIAVVVSLSGLVAFFLTSDKAAVAMHSMKPASLLIATVVAYLILIISHEAGHAFATKYFGRVVPRVGLGWYWFSPIAFVDTSDMWLENRGPRIAVNFAGIYTNMAFAGFSSLGAWLARDPSVTAVCYEFSLLSYVLVLFNLNPLLEYDGYYVLMDFLDRPNLRSNALAWLGRELPRAIWEPGALRKHWIELVYGVATIVYVAAMVGVIVIFYRLLAQQWIARWLSAGWAAAIAWILAFAVVGLSGLLIWSELRGQSRAPSSAP